MLDAVAATVMPGITCPTCTGDLRLVGFFLSYRDEDQKRVCRTPLWCAACDQVWDKWADRDNAPLAPHDVPLPESWKQRLLGPQP
ncbi:hypothetical protein FB565_000343 [Actinoplanes lutulentus]|uniref:Uncharacterized protein n=1 Tax=Actinoplanes lutulentus TaxID=1287878 RepID=A0A327ZKP0_9ACTN|nr:hypothetical protein [Actinoplanes lutulentus]MBB2940639.1 hypothetical protein [Actinoplanes lutulentus]RAK42950.1 hypothetical protein B0I29_10180 [Actinoplanes lutulentus]